MFVDDTEQEGQREDRRLVLSYDEVRTGLVGAGSGGGERVIAEQGQAPAGIGR